MISLKLNDFYRLGFFAVLCLALLPGWSGAATMPAQQGEHVLWARTPIPFDIPVGRERFITFPGPVIFHNTNPALTQAKVRVINNNGILYMKAKQAFAPIRVAVVLKRTGEAILLDIAAKDAADDTPLTVVMADNATSQEGDAVSSGANNIKESSNTAINAVTLLRFAIQQLYAPKRLVVSYPGIHRVPMLTSKSVALLYGDKAMAMPLISWRGGSYYVTAVLLKNPWRQSFTLNHTQFRGRWQAMSFYPSSTLAPQGALHDRTTVILVSRQPFQQALQAVPTGLAR